LTPIPHSGQNDRMASPDVAPKPFQFGLRAIFLAVTLIALALGELKWFGFPCFMTVQFAAIVAILVKSDGTAWRGMVIVGVLTTLGLLILDDFHTPVIGVVFVASLAAWFGGGFTADKETKEQSRFLRWAWLLAFVWLCVILQFSSFD
jgi:hypothetical protein